MPNCHESICKTISVFLSLSDLSRNNSPNLTTIAKFFSELNLWVHNQQLFGELNNKLPQTVIEEEEEEERKRALSADELAAPGGGGFPAAADDGRQRSGNAYPGAREGSGAGAALRGK